MKGKTTSIILIMAFFLVSVIAVFALDFGDPSPDIGTPDNGTIVSSTAGYNYTDGNFTDMQSNNNVYFTVGRHNPTGIGNELEAFINITYDITPLNLSTGQILQLIFNMSYCTSRDFTPPTNAAAGWHKGLQTQWMLRFTTGRPVPIKILAIYQKAITKLQQHIL